MKVWFRRTGFILALAFLALTFVNASWLADSPRGYVKLVAQRGLMQLPGPGAAGDCPARAIEPPVHDFIENTQPAMAQALRLGAQMIAIDVAPTADGRFALFRDPALDCRTNGKGPVSAQTLAQLKALDAGYGYSPDGGQTFPLRGLGQGLIPALEEALTVAGDTPLHYNLRFADAATAGRLIAAIRVAGRNPAERGDSFTGPEAALAPIRAAWPAALPASPDQAAACARAARWAAPARAGSTCRNRLVRCRPVSTVMSWWMICGASARRCARPITSAIRANRLNWPGRSTPAARPAIKPGLARLVPLL